MNKEQEAVLLREAESHRETADEIERRVINDQRMHLSVRNSLLRTVEEKRDLAEQLEEGIIE